MKMDRSKATATKSSDTKRDASVSPPQKADSSPSIDSPLEHILYLQRTVGNQAVGNLLRAGVLQAKLIIGRPNDIYEQEADRVADRVMRMSEPAMQLKPG